MLCVLAGGSVGGFYLARNLNAITAVTDTAYCTKRQARKDFQTLKHRDDLENSLLRSVRLIRSDGGLQLYGAGGGTWWLPEGPIGLLPALLAQQETDLYGEIRPGDIVFDCGAHIGVFTRRALDLGAAKVIAVEPAPRPVECFRRNLAGEIATGRVVLVAKGIWESGGVLPFHMNGNGDAAGSFVRRKEGTAEAPLPVTTIDALVNELRLPFVTVIKADIKGAAVPMLRGASSTIRRFHPRIVIATEEQAEDPAQLVSALAQIIPDYRVIPGCCALSDRVLIPEVLFFFPAHQ